MIAPGNGSEQVAQNGGLIRGAFRLQGSQRYRVSSTGTEQMAQSGG